MSNNDIIHIKQTGSTGTYLKEYLKENTSNKKITVYADFQTAGRGQKGNSWESDHGKNLLFSTVFFPIGLKAGKQFIISQIISLAVKDILDKESDYISIKWPNDIYLHEKKIAGILIENDITGDSVTRSIIGVGINLNQEHFMSDAPNPVSLKQITSKTFDVRQILTEIMDRFYYYCYSIENFDKRARISELYKTALFRKDGFHPFEDNTGVFSAKINDIEESGILVLETESGDIKKYAFKEVKYILCP